MKKVDIGYTAGIIDGEGCIHIERQKITPISKKYIYRLEVNVCSTDEWLPNWLAFAWGGTVNMQHSSRYMENANDSWRWKVVSLQAKTLLETILPYLHIKRPQAEVGIIFQKYQSTHKKIGDDVLREEKRQLLHTMKHKGKVSRKLTLKI